LQSSDHSDLSIVSSINQNELVSRYKIDPPKPNGLKLPLDNVTNLDHSTSSADCNTKQYLSNEESVSNISSHSYSNLQIARRAGPLLLEHLGVSKYVSDRDIQTESSAESQESQTDKIPFETQMVQVGPVMKEKNTQYAYKKQLSISELEKCDVPSLFKVHLKKNTVPVRKRAGGSVKTSLVDLLLLNCEEFVIGDVESPLIAETDYTMSKLPSPPKKSKSIQTNLIKSQFTQTEVNNTDISTQCEYFYNEKQIQTDTRTFLTNFPSFDSSDPTLSWLHQQWLVTRKELSLIEKKLNSD
jgi:hypothetical protein